MSLDAQIADFDERIADLGRQSAELRRLRRCLVLQRVFARKRADPLAWAAYSATRSGGRKKQLPDMTPKQRRLYNKLRWSHAISQEVALAQVFPAGHPLPARGGSPAQLTAAPRAASSSRDGARERSTPGR